MDTENVKEHKGIDPENKDVSNRADKMVIVANMDVQNIACFHGKRMFLLLKENFLLTKIKELL